MIARTWHGVTPAAKAGEYLNLMLTVAIPDFRAIPGNRGVHVMRRFEGDTAHFLLLTFWESEDAIRQFAGDDINRVTVHCVLETRDRAHIGQIHARLVRDDSELPFEYRRRPNADAIADRIAVVHPLHEPIRRIEQLALD